MENLDKMNSSLSGANFVGQSNNSEHDTIDAGLSQIIENERYDEAFLWYQNNVCNKGRILELKFFTSLEKYKQSIDYDAVNTLEKQFQDVDFENYRKYLTVKKLYREKEDGYIAKITDILKNTKFSNDETYFGYFLMDIFRNGEKAIEIIQSLNPGLLVNSFKYMFEYENNFYLYIYDYMISIDLQGEISRKGNRNIEDYINIIRIYIACMSDRSDDIEKKQKLIQLFIDYTNYGFYLLNNMPHRSKSIFSDGEIAFLTDIDKAIGKLNSGRTEEGISLLKVASVRYPLMERVTGYYIQRIRRENRKYPYKLSICMIAKDEQKYLDRCLSSIKPLLDSKIAELVFVDTGSKDKTIEIAKKYTDKIYIHPWKNSFCEARNYSLTLANGEYIFVPDADEEIEEGSIEKIIELFKSDDYKQYNTYTFKEKNFSDEGCKNYSYFTRKFIFKNEDSLYYIGNIHTQPNVKFPVKNLDVTILHYGYIMTADIKDKKFQRTTSILKEELRKDPQNIYYRFQLSVSYSMHGDNKEALEQVDKYLQLLENTDKDSINLMYYNNAALIFFSCSLYDKTIKICDAVLKLQPDFIDCIYFKAKSLFKKENYDECLKVSRQYLNLLHEFESHPVFNDDRYLFYSLGSENVILNVCMMSHFLLKDFAACIKIADGFDDDALRMNLHELVESCLKLQRYDYLVYIYENRISKSNEDKIRDAFKYYLEQGLFKCNEEERINCTIAFAKSEMDDDYINLFKLRAGGEVKQDPRRILYFIDRYDIDEVDLVTGSMIIESTLPLLYEYKINDGSDIVELKNLKRSAKFILHRSLNLKQYLKLDREQLLMVLDRYINICTLMIKMGKQDLLEQKELSFISSILNAFSELQKNDILSCVKCIRDGVVEYKEMAKPMELFLEKIVPDYKADVEEYEKEKAGYELNQYSRKVKNQIKNLIENGDLDDAAALINQYDSIIKDDAEIFSFKAVIAIMKNDYENAEMILKSGLEFYENDFDLNYNLSYVYSKLGNFKYALKHYRAALSSCTDDDTKTEIVAAIQNIERDHKELARPAKKKLVFFSKGDDKFIWDIINVLSREYETKKITVTNLKQIDEGMRWADICWFEWCDDLIGYGSKLLLAKYKIIICRLHRYEVFTNYPREVIWENVDKLIIVEDHLKILLAASIPNIEKRVDIVTINNGVDVCRYEFTQRNPGFNIAYIGYINSRKNPALLLQIINKLVKKDKRYKLYLAGQFQEPLLKLYWDYQVKQMKLEDNIIFQGWRNDISKWLEDKNYILSTSIHESFGYGIAEAMATGIKPVIHRFPYSEQIWDEEYLFSDIDEAVDMILSGDYNSQEYREFIEDNYSLQMQMDRIKSLLKDSSSKNNKYYINSIKEKLNSNISFKSIDDMTMIIPTYNRAQLLRDDIKKGYKLGEQKKVIIDDCSDNLNKEILDNLMDERISGLQKIIHHKVNNGVAETYRTGINAIKTKYTIFSGDDDIILSYDYNRFKGNLVLMDNNYDIIVPRYVYNLKADNELSLGYDRSQFNNIKNEELLRNIFLTGEMYAFNAGAIYKTDNLRNTLPEKIFRVSEDYIMLTRVLSKGVNNKIKVTENYLYVRRVSPNTLSKGMNVEKISLNIISMLVSGYYCLKYNLVSPDECINAILMRGKLLQDLYGYGMEFSSLTVKYITGKLEKKEFIEILIKKNVINDTSIDDIPYEVTDIKQFMK